VLTIVNYGIENRNLRYIREALYSTKLRQHFFSERVINIWNKRDEDTVSASSLNCFNNNNNNNNNLICIAPVCAKRLQWRSEVISRWVIP